MWEEVRAQAIREGIVFNQDSPPTTCFELDLNSGAVYVRRDIMALNRLVEIAKLHHLQNIVLDLYISKTELIWFLWPARIICYRHMNPENRRRFVEIRDLLKFCGFTY
jgi:hypothetical protein